VVDRSPTNPKAVRSNLNMPVGNAFGQGMGMHADVLYLIEPASM